MGAELTIDLDRFDPGSWQKCLACEIKEKKKKRMCANWWRPRLLLHERQLGFTIDVSKGDALYGKCHGRGRQAKGII